jgi:hypothetical protein
VVPTCLTLRGQHCIYYKDVCTSCGSGHKIFSGLNSPWVHDRDLSHDGCQSYRTIETASSKPRLEAMGPKFTSSGTRILTFLPWRRCVIAESKSHVNLPPVKTTIVLIRALKRILTVGFRKYDRQCRIILVRL